MENHYEILQTHAYYSIQAAAAMRKGRVLLTRILTPKQEILDIINQGQRITVRHSGSSIRY